MNSTRIHSIFQTFGKLINLDVNFGGPYASGIKAAVVALQAQNASAATAGDPYGELQSLVGPALNSVRSIVQGLDRLPLVAKAGVDAYVKVIGTAEFNQPATTPPATVLSSLVTSMNVALDTVVPSGTFYNWFLQTYGVTLPSHSPPTIADSLITTTIV